MKSKSINWIKLVTRPTSLLKATPLFAGTSNGMIDIVGVGLSNHLLEPIADKQAWWIDQEEFQAFTRATEAKSEDINFLSDEAGRATQICDNIVQVTEKIGKDELRLRSNSELAHLWEKYHDSLYEYGFVSWGLHVFDNYLVNRIKDLLQELLKQLEKDNQLDNYFDLLTTKIELIAADEEELELLKIRSVYDQEGLSNKVRMLLDNHAKNYGWLPMYDHDLDPWGSDYFLDKLQKLPPDPEEVLSLKTRRQHYTQKQINRILSELDNDELSSLAQILQIYLVLRTYRTDILRIAYFNLDPLVREIARRLEWDRNDIAYLTIEEIYNYLSHDNKPAHDEVKRRRNNYLLLRKGDEQSIYSSKSSIDEVLWSELGAQREIESLQGEGIYKGVVEGEVKIVESVKDEEKMNEGDILVATMTTPDMHNIIAKATAIVTDEGGRTSHAALVSRELLIPCVIGTRFATRYLRDGDRVTVDSYKGTINRIDDI